MCDGWRRELGVDEVREHYMDAKFGGEDADNGGDHDGVIGRCAPLLLRRDALLWLLLLLFFAASPCFLLSPAGLCR